MARATLTSLEEASMAEPVVVEIFSDYV